MELQENLNAMVEEFDATYGYADANPVSLTLKDLQDFLSDVGVSEEISEELEKAFSEYFEDDYPLTEILLDSKLVKANEQRKKEGKLIKQVETLQASLKK